MVDQYFAPVQRSLSSSSSHHVAKKHDVAFQLPPRMTQMVALSALIVASMYQLISMVTLDIGNRDYDYRMLSTTTTTISNKQHNYQTTIQFLYTESDPTKLHPRVVFLDGSPWKRYRPEMRPGGNRTSLNAHPIYYPLTLRRGLNETTDDKHAAPDPTRLYHITDSMDLPSMERRRWPQHEFDPHCVPMADWQSSFYPVCNNIHADNDMRQAFIDQDISLLSNKGFWRSAWKYNEGAQQRGLANNINGAQSTTVWKTFKFAHNFEEKYYEDTRVDAVAMERLTASPYIINMYGVCGLTVVQEFSGKDLAQVVDGGRMNSIDKLKIATQIARGVADIHSIRGDNESGTPRPAMVHNDINMANLLFGADNRPIMNDFNIAILLMKHNETNATCPFYSNFPNPQWKAPEEQVVDTSLSHPPIVNEKIDIYALGNIFFRIAVGAAPWKRPEAERLYHHEKTVVSNLKKYNGTLPVIPSEIQFKAKTDPALDALLQATRLCYRFNPKIRPTAADVVTFLEQALQTVQPKVEN